jgi:hypothetical protein
MTVSLPGHAFGGVEEAERVLYFQRFIRRMLEID